LGAKVEILTFEKVPLRKIFRMITIPHLEIKKHIDGAKKIMLTSHFSPDGDALGSILAMKQFLTAYGKESIAVVPNSFPDFLKWLPGLGELNIYEGNEDKIKEESKSCDLVIILDYNHLGRIKDLKDAIDVERQKVILIDHHQQPDEFDVNVSDVESSSTCELLFRILEELAPEKINEEIATCLYTGILTDTGSFRHSCTTSFTHQVAAKLIDLGANNSAIQERIGNSGTYDRLRLIGFALHEKLKLSADGKVAYFALSMKDMEDYNYQSGDTEGLVNYGLSIQGVIMAVLIKEAEEYVKMSFRCVGEFSVNEFARKYFNGGGHTRAAGGRCDDTLENTVTQFLDAVENEKHLLY
tara:strand:- start:1312 stop:2376 length:1065 start_codon:yes stop_codon:yes gene_type:complete